MFGIVFETQCVFVEAIPQPIYLRGLVPRPMTGVACIICSLYWQSIPC